MGAGGWFVITVLLVGILFLPVVFHDTQARRADHSHPMQRSLTNVRCQREIVVGRVARFYLSLATFAGDVSGESPR